MLPVLVCDKAAGTAMTTRARPTNRPRPKCPNDVRLMSASPVRVFASLITRPLGFVKVGDGRIDWERRFHISLSETDPDAPAWRFPHGSTGCPGPVRCLAGVRAALRRAEDRLSPRPYDAGRKARPAQPALGGHRAERTTAE